ncbi:hypothetical protein SXCC_04076 [Gluconacetobacter sp. SXCC-1]|nr:hypothetical protein SXCC_04076 [Gluconacetobacter sp. SXCC-1]
MPKIYDRKFGIFTEAANSKKGAGQLPQFNFKDVLHASGRQK